MNMMAAVGAIFMSFITWTDSIALVVVIVVNVPHFVF